MNGDRWDVMNNLKIYFWFSALIWTVAVGASLAWNVYQARSTALEAAFIQARVGFEKDVLYRRWNATMHKVYVPVSDIVQPNPYLLVPNRELSCGPGMKLTMVNPAYMTRMVHGMQGDGIKAVGHITSLKPLNPENDPDQWERSALEQLAANRNMEEVTAVEARRTSEVVRLMRPLRVEAPCMECHQAQGYKIGDIRGGISSLAPLQFSYWNRQVMGLVIGHAFLWFMSIAGMLLFLRLLLSSVSRNQSG
ncbi:MAG: DUF3365 domain-containing protein [Thermodesulfobacteriota bacterium]